MNKTNGIIVKGIGSFYYISTPKGIIESRAKGSFRKDKITPLIGDKVEIRLNDDGETGYITKIYPRSSILKRPAVSNITQVVIVFSIDEPEYNSWLLDKFLVLAEYNRLNIIICINKIDLGEIKAKKIKKTYEDIGYTVILLSSLKKVGLDILVKKLENEVSVFAGPSGVGKSSILNLLNDKMNLEVGEISKKTKRGKHTTRHIELLDVGNNSLVLDTPGFSSLKLDFIREEELKHYFKEINYWGKGCKFISCIHEKEPGCKVKEEIIEKKISKDRYHNYLSFLNEIRKNKKY